MSKVHLNLPRYLYADEDSKLELVPVTELLKFREFNRLLEGKYSKEQSFDNIKKLEDVFKTEGITSPLIIEYSVEDNAVLLIEGNHRLNVALELGVRYLPARVVRRNSSFPNIQKAKSFKVSGFEPNQYGYVPADLKPSQVGIQATKPIINGDESVYMYGGSIEYYGNKISDKYYKWNLSLDDLQKYFDANNYIKLGDLIKHDELFEKYPYIYRCKVYFEDLLDEDIAVDSYVNHASVYHLSTIHIKIHNSYYKKNGKEKYTLQSENPEYSKESCLLHEIQHICQQADGRSFGRSHEEILVEYVQKRTDLGHVDRIKLAAYFNYKLQESEQEAMKTVFFWLNDIGLSYKDDKYINWDFENFKNQNESQNMYANGGEVLLAPNGKPSNLTPEQYKLVRSDAFISWFGNWENINFLDNLLSSERVIMKRLNNDDIHLFKTHSDRNSHIKKICSENKTQVKSSIGNIKITTKGLEHSLRHSVDNIVLQSINFIDDLFSNAIGYGEYPYIPKSENDNNKDFLHFKYLFCIVEFESKYYFFRASIPYSKANRSYILRDYNFEEIKSPLEQIAVRGQKPNLTIDSNGQYKDNRLNSLLQTYSKNVSKMLDDNYEPLVCYHGTNREFTVFRSDVGSSHDLGFYGRGFYFTFNPESNWMKFAKGEAGYYGSIVKDYFIKIINPFDFSELSEYKGIKINYLGTESIVFLSNIALKYPELSDKIKVQQVKWNKETQENDVNYVPISILPELIEKYSKMLKTFETEDNFGEKNKISGYVKSELVDYDYTSTGGTKVSYTSIDTLGRYDKKIKKEELEILLVVDAIEKYDRIEAKYQPEGYMTRYPEITDLIKKEHDGIIQSKFGDEVVVFEPTQIKLADGTNVTFNGNNPDVRFNDGGEVLLAPNGKPSNLTPEQYKIVRSDAFIAWFGDWINSPETASKVVDENGEPLVVYHGTIKNFNVFDRDKIKYFKYKNTNVPLSGGFFFSDNYNNALSYVKHEYFNLKQKIKSFVNGHIKQCFLNIRFIYVAEGSNRWDCVFSRKNNECYSTDDISRAVYTLMDNDGVLFKNVIDTGNKKIHLKEANIYVAFYPEQIKLADGTNVTFDGNNPDVRFKDGGGIDDKIISARKMQLRNKLSNILKTLDYKTVDIHSGKSKEDLFIQRVVDMIYNGYDFKSKLDIERIATKEFGFDDAKKVRELTEYAILFVGRDISKENDVKEAYDKLVSLYANQPYSTNRTVKSQELGQFSTPAPMAYLMGIYVGIDKSNINWIKDDTDAEQRYNHYKLIYKKNIYKITEYLIKDKPVKLKVMSGYENFENETHYSIYLKKEFNSVDEAKEYVSSILDNKIFEPTAGNGMLTIAGNPQDFVVNELDFNRYNNLLKDNYKLVLNQDATKPFNFDYKFDGLLANPPFATTKIDKIVDNFKISGLENQIMINSLDLLKDDARGAFIIGGHTEFDSAGRIKSAKDKSFLSYLYSRYNVEDVINVSGMLYGRQGTTYPIRIILFNGRKSIPSGYYPLKNEKLNSFEPFSHRVINNFDELYERFKKTLLINQ